MFMLIYVPDLYGPTILLPSTLWLHLQILFINYEIMRLTIGPVPSPQSGLLLAVLTKLSLWLYRNQKLLKTTKDNQTQQAVISPDLPHGGCHAGMLQDKQTSATFLSVIHEER